MGSSKSYIGLMRHLRWVEDPDYRGFCVRKNSTTIMRSGGLFEDALYLYRQVYPNVIPKYKDQKIVFPSGATVSFSHYESDSDSEKWRGIQSSNFMYDESTDAEEHHIWFLISRLRTRARMTPGIWLTCNPSPDHFLRKWVDWWLYPEGHPKFGLPDPSKQGVERWIYRENGEIRWGDSREELIERYGKKDLPLDHENQIKPMTMTCLFGTVFDNPPLLKAQPQYLTALENQPEVEKQRNLYGNWEARISESTYFQRTWCEEITGYDESQVERVVRAYDMAGTLKNDSNPSPDYTVATKMAKMKDGTYIVLDVKRTRIRFGEWEKFIIQNAMEDRELHREVTILLPEDPNPAAKAATALMIRNLAESGLYAQKIRASTSKLDRFRPFSAMAQNNGIKFLKGCGQDLENKNYNTLDFVYKELEAFDGNRRRGESGHDRLNCRV